MSKRPLLSALVVLTLALAACAGEAPAPADSPPAVQAVAPQEAPAPAPPPAEMPTPAPAPADEDADVEDELVDDMGPFEFAEGESVFDLAGVNSFRQRWVLSMSGPGAEAAGMDGMRNEVVSAFVREPEAFQIAVLMDGIPFMETIRIGDDAWMRSAGQDWQQLDLSQMPFDPAAAMMLQGAFLIDGLGLDGTRVGREEVNGVQTVHYTMDLSTMQEFLQDAPQVREAELHHAQVDYWVDEERGFIVKYHVELEGRGLDSELGDGPVMAETMFELYDLGAAISIEPPQ